jgi:glucose/arabinose dehydrogenase
MDINPKDKTVWFTDNQTDGMGDDTPQANSTALPRVVGNISATPSFTVMMYRLLVPMQRRSLKGMSPPSQWTKPQVEFPAHQAQLGMTFIPERCSLQSTKVASL